KTHTIDVANRKLGRVATEIACLLIGKNKPNYAPHKDNGDMVIIENPDQIAVTGEKKKKKKYFNHSGYLGGLKEKTFEELLEKKPGKLIKQAVYGMLPKNKLRDKRIKRLKIKNNN
ncbi:MAG: 50S ribosomal protein L13, partial [Minisyncoccales bacterium]